MPAASASRTLRETDGAARNVNAALIAGIDAGEDLHQRRLAGAVLAHQRVNFARTQIEADVRQRRDAAKALAYTGCDQQRHTAGLGG